jgi:hypothetical protein
MRSSRGIIVSARSFRPLPSTTRARLEVQVTELEVRELGAPEAREEPGGQEGVVAEAERDRVLGERLEELALAPGCSSGRAASCGWAAGTCRPPDSDHDLLPHRPRLSRVPGQIVGYKGRPV